MNNLLVTLEYCRYTWYENYNKYRTLAMIDNTFGCTMVTQTPGIKVSELARAHTIHASTCSNMLDKLEARGLVERKRNSPDQRAVHLFLTEAGSSLLVMVYQPARTTMISALENLSDADLNKLADGLNA